MKVYLFISNFVIIIWNLLQDILLVPIFVVLHCVTPPTVKSHWRIGLKITLCNFVALHINLLSLRTEVQ